MTLRRWKNDCEDRVHTSTNIQLKNSHRLAQKHFKARGLQIGGPGVPTALRDIGESSDGYDGYMDVDHELSSDGGSDGDNGC